MHIRSFLIAFAVAGSAYADDSSVVNKSAASENRPMAWSFRLLETAQRVFDKEAPKKAPGASMSFRLPKVEATSAGNQVEIIDGSHHIPLTMPSSTSFVLKSDTPIRDSDALVVVNRDFPKGEFNHPLVQVRSPGLENGAKRMGDLRVACAAQVAMAKAESFKFRAALAGASLFGLDLCEKQLKVNEVDAPSDPYDTLTVEEGGRRLVMQATAPELTRLGDKAWSDDARITYTLNGSPVR